MKFRVILDKAKEEEVVATVHRRTNLIDEIEALILRDEQTDALAAYQEDEIRLLELSDVECITADGGKVYAIADDGKRYLLKKRLYEIEESLPPGSVLFIRWSSCRWRSQRSFRWQSCI